MAMVCRHDLCCRDVLQGQHGIGATHCIAARSAVALFFMASCVSPARVAVYRADHTGDGGVRCDATVVASWRCRCRVRWGNSIGYLYLATQSLVLWHYLSLCIWPSDLCIDYRWPPVASIGVAFPWVGLTLGLMATGVWLYWRGMLLGWLVLAVFLLLAPTSTFIPVTDIALDHRMYLATAAVIACLIIIVQRLLSRWRWASEAWVMWAIAGSILMAMFIRTSKRANDWSSGFDLWHSAAMVVPHNPRALQNLTNAADQEGRRGELLVVLETLRTQCLIHGQRAPAVASRLAEELMKSGQPIDVEPLLAEAIEGLSPSGPIDERQEHAAARVNLGLLLLQRGDLAQAEEQLKRGLVSDPKQAFAHAILGDLAFQRQEFDIAVDHFQKAVALSPDWDQAISDLAKAKLAADAKP